MSSRLSRSAVSSSVRSVLAAVCILTAAACLWTTNAQEYNGADDQEKFRTQTPENAQTQAFLQSLQASGQGLEGGDGGRAAMREACGHATKKAGAYLDDTISTGYVTHYGKMSLEQICSALLTQQGTGELTGGMSDTALNVIATEAVAQARSFNLPYISNVEVEGQLFGDNRTYSLTSVQPLWEDEAGKNFVFNQVSWYHEGSDTDDGDPDNTVNFGLAYRRLMNNDTMLMGGNVFFDHQLDQNHNRVSLGVDARTSLYGLAANHYIPLTDWKSIDEDYEAIALGGSDVEFSGKFAEYPAWTFFAKGFTWSAKEEQSNIYGYNASVEWSPVKALVLATSMQDENHSDPEIKGTLRFKLDFSDDLRQQFTEKTQLADVSAHVWDKVRRENTIRTQVREKRVEGAIVLQTVGANTVTTGGQTLAVSGGMSFGLPANVIVANTVGAIVRLQLIDGGLLTLGQNTEVNITPTEVTLVSGSMQYVSGSSDVTVVIPGGTIDLIGTDIDVVSDGANSTVRVRDGRIIVTGTSSGTADITSGMAQAVGGVVSVLAAGTPDFLAHEDQITQEIDWVADAQSGAKVAPYLSAAPYIVSENLTPGQTIEIGLEFNRAVTVSGGVPALDLLVGGVARTAPLISGSGSNVLVFGYVVQAGDAGLTGLSVTGFDDNGAGLGSGTMAAITNVLTTPLTFSGGVADVTAPSGYAVTFTTDPVNASNETSAAFQITGAEVGADFDYTITSSGGAGSVTGSGTIATATQNVTGIDVSGLPVGTLTVSLTLTDTSNNTGAAATDTVVKNYLPNLSFVDQDFTWNDQQNYTFNNIDIGAAAADRLVIVVVQTQGNTSTITGVTVGGAAATIHAQGSAPGSWQNSAIASVAVASGTTANITVTTAQTARLARIFVYRATNLQSMTPTGASDGPDGAYLSQNSLSVPVSAGGFIIGGAHLELAATDPAIYTENNALAVVDAEGDDEILAGGDSHYYVGHSENLPASASYPVIFRNANDNHWFGSSIVSWR